MSIRSLTYEQSVRKRYHSDKHFSEFFTYKMAAKINWRRYGTKLRRCQPMHAKVDGQRDKLVTVVG